MAYALLNLATQLGGTKLDCFDTVLPKIYGAVGFVETGRDAWNEEYKPDGWDFDTFKAYNNGRPDVVYMAFDPAAAQTATLDQVVQSRTPVKRGFIEIACSNRTASSLPDARSRRITRLDAPSRLPYGRGVTLV